MMQIQDFQTDSLSAFTGTTTVLGREKVEIMVDFEDNSKPDVFPPELLPAINARLDWLDHARQTVTDALVKDDMLELAEDWASSAEQAEDEEQECYIMEDGQKVFLPITVEDFSNSLRMDSVVFQVSWDGTAPVLSLDLYMHCCPDYFAYHSVLAYVEPDGTVTSGSLAG